MYKKKIVIFLSICLLLYTVWVGYNQIFPGKTNLHARSAYGHLKSLNELENVTESIVKVKVIGNGKQFYKTDNYAPTWGYTITPVEITKVYKSEELAEKKVINIIEPCFYYTYPVLAIRDLITIENYKPLKVNKQYIILITSYKGVDENRIGAYDFIDSKLGRYVAKEELDSNKNLDELSANELDLFEVNNIYKDIMKEIYKKYKQ